MQSLVLNGFTTENVNIKQVMSAKMYRMGIYDKYNRHITSTINQ